LKNQKSFSARRAILINKRTVKKAVGTLITGREVLTEILLAFLSLYFYYDLCSFCLVFNAEARERALPRQT